MAYYFNSDPVAKIIDVKGASIDSNLLKNTVAAVAGAAGMGFTDVTYYDFRYPNATNMMFIAELTDAGGNDFTINLTSSFGYSERSWSAAQVVGCCNQLDFWIDGVSMYSTSEYWNNGLGYGFITFSELLPDINHVISENQYGVLVIVYTVS